MHYCCCFQPKPTLQPAKFNNAASTHSPPASQASTRSTRSLMAVNLRRALVLVCAVVVRGKHTPPPGYPNPSQASQAAHLREWMLTDGEARATLARTNRSHKHVGTDTTSCSIEPGFNIAGHDMMRQCTRGGGNRVFVPCLADSTHKCMRRCGRRPGCAAFAFSVSSHLCWLKSSSVMYLGKREASDQHVLGLCAPRSPPERSTAVCLVGQLRAASAIPSIRKHGM